MRSKTVVLLVVGLLVAAAAGWWFASPWWTLRQMREAAAAKDADRLSAYVDYPALRADLKAELSRQMLGTDSAGAGSVASLVAATIAGPMIDAMVTPEGVAAMFAAQGKAKGAAAAETATSTLPSAPAKDADLSIDRDGLNAFRAKPKDGGATMIFNRDGLGWRLAGVDLAEPSPGRVEGGAPGR